VYVVRSMNRSKTLAALTALTLILSSLCPAGLASEKLPQPRDSEDWRPLVASLGTEPLLALYTSDAMALPALFNKSNLAKMIQDPAYAKGAETLVQLINERFGAEFKLFWPDFSRQMSGPAVLAVLQTKTDNAEEDSGFRLVLAVTTKDAESAAKLRELWPKVPPQATSLLAMLRLQPVLLSELPASDKFPEWLRTGWPKGDLNLRALPQKLGKSILEFADKVGDTDDLENWLPMIVDLERCGMERLGLSVNMGGEFFSDELEVLAGPENQKHPNHFWHVAQMLKAEPGPWNGVTAALPGEQDAMVLMQTEPKAMGDDLPFALQTLERFLRGKKWGRGKGKLPESLAADRFKFLLNCLQGSFGIVGTPAISGDLRLMVAAALNNPDPEVMREELTKGLATLGAEFSTLDNARRIGTAAPLGANFQGRGLFSAPVIGLSPGWAWLCSSSAAYQDLTAAFKAGRTMAAEIARERTLLKQRGLSDDWRDGDALRVKINMDKVVKLAYASWLLSGDEGPFIAGWKVPADMLPQPAIFNGKLGVLKAGLSREDKTLKGYANSVFPGTSLGLVVLLQSIAGEIDLSREFAKEAASIGGETLPVKEPVKESGK
jgi:hypothetical protein